jgi:hypothetical protein
VHVAGPQPGVALGIGEVATLVSILSIAVEIVLIGLFAGRVLEAAIASIAVSRLLGK